MNIEALLNGTKNVITIDDEFFIPKESFQNSGILDLSKIKVDGKLTMPSDDNLLLDISCKGIMTIEDSVSLKPVKYHFSFEINENVLENIKDKEESAKRNTGQGISPEDIAYSTCYTVENMNYGEIDVYGSSFQEEFLDIVEN